ncbi:MAG: M50 family metallopeptidase [Lachnospirales bacterium]
MSLIFGILIFGFIVFIHELGHFLFAKKNGILVEEFAIGMGKILFSVQKGETRYSIRLLPIGGFCAMLGEDDDNFDERSFNSKSVGARMAVILAGAFFNALLAIIIFSGFGLFNGYRTLEVEAVVENSFAYESGLLPGDEILEINGNSINNYNEIFFETQFSSDGEIDLVYERDDQKYEVTGNMTKNPENNSYFIGVQTKYMTGVFAKEIEGFERGTFFGGLKSGIDNTLFVVESVFLSVKLMINNTIGVDQLSGPIGIVSTIDESYETSMESGGFGYAVLNMLNLMAMLSANLAVFNLLPLPALDGGRFVFLVYEAITKKKVPPEKEGKIHFIGLVLLMSLAVFVAFNDVIKLLN